MSPEDAALRDRMADMNDEQLSDLIAQIDAAEIISKNKTIVMAEAALWYVTTLGWPVFPLIAGRKAPLTKHGFLDASADPDVVRSWWTHWPDANIGIPTGRREQGGCGFDVIDVDGPVGFASLADIKHRDCAPDCSVEAFCPATGSLPEVVARAFTPGDPDGVVNGRPRRPGRHLYTPAVGTANATNMLPKIDLRGDGGYVVAAPSTGPSGARYAWITRPVAA